MEGGRLIEGRGNKIKIKRKMNVGKLLRKIIDKEKDKIELRVI